ncbi:MAG TPA: hypothetical protein VJ927_08555 [Actinomycetota bacterium]|nr:hypothetical protein [Actinomycetota bacterium]
MRIRIRRRRLMVPIAVFALTAAALGAPTTASSEIDPLLPSLGLDQLLDIANVEAPPAGVGLELHIDFPTENPLQIGDLEFTALTAVINPDRSVETQSAIAAGSGDNAAEAEECTDPAFLPTGRSWSAEDMPVVWRFRRGSTPPENSIYRTQGALREAHGVWPTSKSRCSDTDRIDFSYEFAGLTRKSVKYDNVNIVEFGPLGSGALAINYTWFSGTRILETDLRLNRTDYNWTNRRGGKKYQVVNVTAHELGHQVGLDDLSDPHGGLTMFGRISRGEMKKTTLGTGDIRGASRLSP